MPPPSMGSMPPMGGYGGYGGYGYGAPMTSGYGMPSMGGMGYGLPALPPPMGSMPSMGMPPMGSMSMVPMGGMPSMGSMPMGTMAPMGSMGPRGPMIPFSGPGCWGQNANGLMWPQQSFTMVGRPGGYGPYTGGGREPYTGGFEGDVAPPLDSMSRVGGLAYPEGGYTAFGGGFGRPYEGRRKSEYGPMDMYGGLTGGGFPYSYNVRDTRYGQRNGPPHGHGH